MFLRNQFVNTKLKWDRSLTDYDKIRHLISHFIRNRSLFVSKIKDGSYLDIGCGPNVRDDWYNIDWYWRKGIDACWDVANGLPIPDGSVAGVFSEHCMEHIPFSAFVFVSQELYRVLKPEGWIRIVVPDAELYLDEYRKFRDQQPYSMPYQNGDIERSMGYYSPMYSINRIMRDHGHQHIYDFDSMRLVLEGSGFINVQKMSYGVTNDSRLANDAAERKIESLYVEAQKKYAKSTDR